MLFQCLIMCFWGIPGPVPCTCAFSVISIFLIIYLHVRTYMYILCIKSKCVYDVMGVQESWYNTQQDSQPALLIVSCTRPYDHKKYSLVLGGCADTQLTHSIFPTLITDHVHTSAVAGLICQTECVPDISLYSNRREVWQLWWQLPTTW